MSDLYARFQAFRQRAPEEPVAETPAPARLPQGRWDPCDTPQGAVPVRADYRPVPYAAELRGQWPCKMSRAALGPPDGWLWLDLETTGLSGGSGTRAFLVGIGRLEGDGLALRQYLLTDLDRETALMSAIAREVASAGALVTFNGKSFDWPLLRDRATVAGFRLPTLPHWDVLHPSRTLWGSPCDLGHLQGAVLDDRRTADVPGEWIPSLYRAWLDGDGEALDGVCAHNRADLWALAGVAARLCAILECGPRVGALPPELYGLGRLYEKLGATEAAVSAYLACHAAGGREGGQRAATVLKRLGRHPEAVPLWEAGRRGPVPSVQAAVELAKYLEHRRKDPSAALAVIREALRLAPWLGPRHRGELEHRLARLSRKVGEVPSSATGR